VSPPSRAPSFARDAHDAQLRGHAGPVSGAELAARLAGCVAIVIPAYQEAANLQELLPRIPAQLGGVATAVLVVDDGSSDGSEEAARGAGALVARLRQNRGGGAALRAGYALAVDAGARAVVTMDADGQHRPEELERIAAPVLSGRVQLAQGSRVIGHSEGGVRSRELGIALFSRLLRGLTGERITDCSNSFRAIDTRLLAQLDLRQHQFHAAELLIEAITRGAVLEEVPVSVKPRTHGVSKKPATLRYGLGFCAAILDAWLRARRRGWRRAQAPGAAQAWRTAAPAPLAEAPPAGEEREPLGAERLGA
jgi:glycosyltransferase involved in cell wall biosynthesis